jgi:5-methylcytosine-specific restriction endonuclease McrBC GTP-binding regulatory subunit McrB
MEDLSQVITKADIDNFKSFSGKTWDKGDQSRNDSKNNSKVLLAKLKIAVTDAANKIWNASDIKSIDLTNLLTQPKPRPGQRGGGIPSFPDYLAVKVGIASEYEEIVRYWIFIEGPRNDASIRLVLGIIDVGKSPSFKEHTKKIQEEYDLNKALYIEDQLNLEQLSDWIVDSIKKFKLSYEQFCSKLQPELGNELERLKTKRGKSEHYNQFKNEEDETDFSEDSDEPAVKAKNLIYYGPPGTGKTYRLQKQQEEFSSRCAFVTFHQSYGYEEFVEGLRPVLIGDADSNSDKNSSDGHDVKYKIEPGSFKRLCDQARRDPTNGYAIFIDEINRGNISKIFGELITLIELDKRSDPNKKQEQQFQVLLAYSKESFTVPANVSIFGSMNTADRSLALIDTALRRRFEFKDLYPDTRETKDDNDPFSAPLAGLMVGSIDVRRMLECINERIEILYDRDHCIGHAYFTGLIKKDESIDTNNKFDKFRNIFFNRIKPLLEEYFFDDWEKIGRVLGDHLKKESRLQFLKKLPLPKDLGNSDDNSDDSKIFLRPRYRWNDNAFSDPEAYVGIYSQS